jgi:uncharacterized protein (TIGR03437 family)
LTQSSTATAGQVSVANAGGGTLQFSAQASTDTGAWLKISGSGAGSAASSAPATIAYTVDPAGLSPGVYAGRIIVSDSAGNQGVAGVALVLAPATQSILLSQSGITINAVTGANVNATQSFSVLNTGGGAMGWSAAASTVSGGDWLSASPASATSIGGQAGSPIAISVNPQGLAAGQYYGAITVSSADAVNNPQSVSVLLNVAPGGGGTSIAVSSGAAILSGAAGTAAQSQQITLFNPGVSSVNFTAAAIASDGGSWLTITPASGSLTPGGTPLTIHGDLSSLAAGIYTGTVRVTFDNGTVDPITVILISTSGSAAPSASLRPRAVTACATGKADSLIAAFAEPLDQSALQAGFAQLVRVLIVDDCGHPVSAGGAAQVTFNNAAGPSDIPVPLHDSGNGVWEATWTPVNSGAKIALSVAATETTASGMLQSIPATITASVTGPNSGAAAQASGVVNAASGALAVPGRVVPGEIVAIYGTGLAAGDPVPASTVPLSTSLGGTELLVGGQPVPLYYASSGQIDGEIPQNLNPNASYQLVIARGNTRSVPAPLTVVKYDPAIFTMDSSGSGQGAVEIAGTPTVAAPLIAGGRPVLSGTEYLTIFCTGLGAVAGPNGEAPPADGAGTPTDMLYRTRAPVSVTIGGADVPVSFSGLTPGVVALYQVNVAVPAGVQTGDAVPIVLTVTDPDTGALYVANTVTVAVQ